MKTPVALLLLTAALAATACSSTPPTSRKGAICIAEKSIILFDTTAAMTQDMAKEMMQRTVGNLRPNERFEVLDRKQNKDPKTNTASGPAYLRLRSLERPALDGWAMEQTIRSRLVE